MCRDSKRNRLDEIKVKIKNSSIHYIIIRISARYIAIGLRRINHLYYILAVETIIKRFFGRLKRMIANK